LHDPDRQQDSEIAARAAIITQHGDDLREVGGETQQIENSEQKPIASALSKTIIALPSVLSGIEVAALVLALVCAECRLYVLSGSENDGRFTT
jgi:hypothetical protein